MRYKKKKRKAGSGLDWGTQRYKAKSCSRMSDGVESADGLTGFIYLFILASETSQS